MAGNPGNKGGNKPGDALIAKFLEEYEAAIARVKVSAETTETAGWQAMYDATMREARDARHKLADELRNLAELLDVGTLTEDGEKAVKEVAKGAEYYREQVAVFNARTVYPVKAAVDAAENLIRGLVAQADLDEERHGLIAKGLGKRARDAVAKLPRAEWNDQTGVVAIKLPANVRQAANDN